MKPIIRKIIIGISILSIIGIGIGIYFALRTGKGPDGCGGGGYLCKITGKCIDSNFCGGDGLVNSESDCKCKLDCPSGQQSFPSSIDMKQDPTDSTKWVTDGNIHCGIPCSEATADMERWNGAGGIGWCAPDPPQYCGIGNVSSKGQSVMVDNGCFPKDTWYKCDKSICKGKSETEACDPSGYCKKIDSCGDKNTPAPAPDNKYHACLSSTDCKDAFGIQGTCKTDNAKLQAKNIIGGYCVPPSGGILQFDKGVDHHCGTIDQIGNTQFGEIVVCDSDSRGVNGKIQCPDSEDKNGCTKNDICNNGWQARLKKGVDKNCSLVKPYTTGTEKGLFCCDPDSTITPADGGEKWCCSVPGTNNCENNTTNPYSSNMAGNLTAHYEDTIHCRGVGTDGDDDCNKAAPDFYNTLTVDGFKPNQTDPNASNYAKLYCDENKVCKAQCGFIDTPQGGASDYVVSNPPPSPGNPQVSFCSPTNHNCVTEAGGPEWLYGAIPVNNMPICYDTKYTTDADRENNLYWSAATGTGLKYNQKYKLHFTGEKCNTPSMCMKHATDTDGVYNVAPDSVGNSCTFTADCANMKYTPTGMKKSIKWSDGLTQLSDNDFTDANYKKWTKIAQHIPYNPVPAPGPPGFTCTGLTQNDSSIPEYDIPIGLTQPLKVYNYETQLKCDNTDIKPKLNTSGQYCTSGVYSGDNECY